MKIKFLDLSIKNKNDLKKHLKIYKAFLTKGTFVLGEAVIKFENFISRLINKKYTIGCSSGTNAIYLALKALNIKKGDHVLVPCLSWVSTFTAVKMVGAEPIGVDISQDFQMELNEIKKRVTKKTKAIILVYFTGHYKFYSGLKEFCKKNDIKIIEDCAQSFGSKIKNKLNGNFGDIACFSMNPMKVYSAFGDAGAVSTNNSKIFNKLKILRYAGTINKEKVIYPELNHKIDTLQSLILLESYKNLNKIIGKRIDNANLYNKHLNQDIHKPYFSKKGDHIYYTYTILTKNRDKVKKYLTKNNIETQIQHPVIISQHPGLKNKFNNTKYFPKGRHIVKEILSLPIHEKLSKKEIFYVIKKINKFLN